MARHRYAPSHAKRWLACAGSVNLIQGHEKLNGSLRPESTASSLKGDITHAVLYRALATQTHPMGLVGENIEVHGGEHHPVTAEHAASATVTFDYVQARIGELQAEYQARVNVSDAPEAVFKPQVFYEHTVDAGAAIHRCTAPADMGWPEDYEDYVEPAPKEECTGPADVILIGSGVMEVIDHKDGHLPVEAHDPQLILYLLGALKECRQGEVQRMRATVIQPNANHPDGTVRSADLDESMLLQWSAFIHDAMVASESATAKLVPGDHCQFCPAKKAAICPALGAKVAATLTGDPEPAAEESAVRLPVEAEPEFTAPTVDLTAAMSRDPGALSEEQMVELLTNATLIRGWLNAVEDRAMRMLQGQSLTLLHQHFKLVEGRGSYDWNVEEPEIRKKLSNCVKTKEAGGGKLKKAEYLTEKVLSTAQARKQLKPLVSPRTWEGVAKLITRTAGKPTLAPITDPREPLSVRAADVFEKVETKEEDATPDWLS